MFKKMNCQTGIERRFVSHREFAERYGLGLASAKNLAESIGCIHRVGRRTLYDILKADRYFDDENSVVEQIGDAE